MTLVFRSDNHITYAGFAGSVQILPNPVVTPAPSASKNNVISYVEIAVPVAGGIILLLLLVIVIVVVKRRKGKKSDDAAERRSHGSGTYL